MKEPKALIHKYLRHSFGFPHIWCPGCGHGTVMNAVIGAIDDLKYDKNTIIMVSGIGCSSRAVNYFDFNAIHSTHGKAIAFATGPALAHPDKKVIVLTGDGDAAAIGGNHLIHAARRNINMTVLCLNNSIYGMTGGQTSPTTPEGYYAQTAPYTAVERIFDLCQLAIGAGGTFVARSAFTKPVVLQRTIRKALEHKGLSFVDAISSCPVLLGFYNRNTQPVYHYKRIKEMTLDVKAAEALRAKGKEPEKEAILTGIFKDEKDETSLERYQRICRPLDQKAMSLFMTTLDFRCEYSDEE